MLKRLLPLTLDIVNDSNTSSLNSLAESKTDVQIPNSEDDKNTSARELDLAALWPYPQQLTLIKGSHYFPEAYLSIRIVMKGEEGNVLFSITRSISQN